MDFFEGTEYLEDWSTTDVLKWAWEKFGLKSAIGTSFQGAGLVMMHLAKLSQLPIPTFTLDTGLLFRETLDLKKRLEDFLNIKIETLVPDYSVEEQAKHFGEKLWEREPDQCCTLRKVVPLQAKLKTLDCWITGLRREQSDSRASIGVFELYEVDPGKEIIKLNPMAKWSREEVWDYIKKHQIPYNPLHDKGYSSIGCYTCTRLVGKGENERAGRWTGFNKTECGIHTFMQRKK